MLYFSPLSVTDDKQRDRKHPFSFPQCRQGNLGNCSMYLGTLLVPVLGDLVDAVAWGSKIYTLRGGVDGCEQMCALHAVFVLCVCLRERLIRWGGVGVDWQVLGNRSMHIQDLYVGTFPRFIRNISICC